MKSQYAIMWEFHVKKEHQKEFEEVYGPSGDWVQLFRKAEGFVRTDLCQKVADKQCYVIVDVWESQAAYNAFCNNHGKEYKDLDEQCDSMTEKEIPLGAFHFFT